MDFEFKLPYTTEEVFSLFSNKEFLVERCTALDKNSPEVDVNDGDEKVKITMSRTVTRSIPKVLKKVLGATQTLNMTEEWTQMDDSYFGGAEFEVEGQPISIKTEMFLKPIDTGAIFTMSFNIKAKIPMVGRVVEKFVLTNCMDQAQDELQFTADKLAA